MQATGIFFYESPKTWGGRKIQDGLEGGGWFVVPPPREITLFFKERPGEMRENA